jgi:polyisoprenoid-binding protein YceI
MPARTRRVVIVLASLAVLAVLAALLGPRIYASVENRRAPEALTSSATPSASGADLASLADGTWSVSPGSVGGYRVDEVLNGADVTVVGRTEDVTGSFELSAGQVTSGSVTVLMETVATDSGARDSQFRERFLETDQHPEATFKVTEPFALPGGSSGDARVAGELTLHGVTLPASATTTVASDQDGTVVVTGSVPVALEDYAIARPDLGFVSVASEGVVEFQLRLAQ